MCLFSPAPSKKPQIHPQQVSEPFCQVINRSTVWCLRTSDMYYFLGFYDGSVEAFLSAVCHMGDNPGERDDEEDVSCVRFVPFCAVFPVFVFSRVRQSRLGGGAMSQFY